MSGQVDAKGEWLRRVLGFGLPETEQGSAANTPQAATQWKAAVERWKAASEAVDGQISALQVVLLQSGDPQLKEIAEHGLNAVTGNHRVPLQTALIELGAGEPVAMRNAGPKVLAAVNDFREYLETSEQVAVCDDNPFDTPVSIRATLGAALAAMGAAIAADLNR
jgi:hypothetical protein